MYLQILCRDWLLSGFSLLIGRKYTHYSTLTNQVLILPLWRFRKIRSKLMVEKFEHIPGFDPPTVKVYEDLRFVDLPSFDPPTVKVKEDHKVCRLTKF